MTRTAIVTGGGRGIGAAIAQRLAADGMNVAILDMGPTEDTVKAVEAAGVKGLGIDTDVSDEASVESAVKTVAETLGAPTVLVNNAGILRDNLLFKMTHEEFQKVLSVHLGGAFLMAKAVQAYMVEAKYGRIVSMSSTSALGNRGQTNYSAAKAGIQGMTKTWAIGARQVRSHGQRDCSRPHRNRHDQSHR